MKRFIVILFLLTFVIIPVSAQEDADRSGVIVTFEGADENLGYFQHWEEVVPLAWRVSEDGEPRYEVILSPARTKKAKTCEYDGGDRKLFYDIVNVHAAVIDLASGEEIAYIDLVRDPDSLEGCPFIVTFLSTEKTKTHVKRPASGNFAAWLFSEMQDAPGLASTRLFNVWKQHNDVVLSVAFNPDGKTVIAGGGEEDEKLFVWEIANAEAGHALAESSSWAGWVRDIAFWTDGAVVAYVTRTNLYVLGLERGEFLLRIKGDPFHNRAIAYAPDGATFATAGDGGVRMWDAQTGETLRVFDDGEKGLFLSSENPAI